MIKARRNIGIATIGDARRVLGTFGLSVTVAKSKLIEGQTVVHVMAGESHAYLVWPAGNFKKRSQMSFPYGKSAPYGCVTEQDAVKQMVKEMSFAEKIEYSTKRTESPFPFAVKTVTETVSISLPDFSSAAEFELKAECAN